MLTRIAAVRSAAEILVEFPDIPRDRRERFASPTMKAEACRMLARRWPPISTRSASPTGH
jgi:hypothetical protein